MVFCGKPSKGCETCRARKIRCDQLPDGCSQCTKMHKQCPGYRDQLDLLFRDESEAVVSKAKSKGVKARETQKMQRPLNHPVPSSTHPVPRLEVSPPSEIFHQPLEQGNRAVAAAVASTFSMAPTLVEMATGFFFAHYVLRANGPSLGHLEHLLDTPDLDQNLLTSIHAVGLAGYSHLAKAPHLIADARTQYTKALKLTNAALRSRTDVKKDSTLMAIMILGIFEAVTGCNQRSFDAWAQHINGAAALLKLRGMAQMQTLAGRNMYIQVSTNLLIACIQRKLPMPADVLELRDQIVKFINTDDIAWGVQEAMIEFADFRSKVRCGAMTDLRAILSLALRLDRELTHLFADVPPTWKYQTVFTNMDPDIVFDGHYHVYHDFWLAQIWNGMRSVRILLNEQIRAALLEGFSSTPPLFTSPEYTAQLQASTDVLFKLQADILASVPEFLGCIPRTVSSHLGSDLEGTPSTAQLPPNSVQFATDDRAKTFGYALKSASESQPFRPSGGFLILWPLYLAGRVVITTPRVQQWVSQCLRRVGNSTGIHHALVAATMLEKCEDITVFDEKTKIASLIEMDNDNEAVLT